MIRKLFRIARCSFAGAAICIALPMTSSADPANGERLAQRWCAACHVVSRAQREASADAPPFATLGRSPDFSAGKLAFFLLDPHPKMPDMALTRKDAIDIAEYVAKLGAER